MEYLILGPLEVRDNGETVPIPGVKEKALLALLLVELGSVVSTDRLIFELWGDDIPKRATETLRSLISRLRRHLGKSTIVTQRPGYRIDADPQAIDSHRFDQLADKADKNRIQPARASELGHQALDLWRGPALGDFDGFFFAEAEARRLEERRIALMDLTFESDLELGRHMEMAGELRQAVDRHPYHEPFYRQLMLALARSGRPAEALSVYEEAERWYSEEMGFEPSQALQTTRKAVAAGDERLLLPSKKQPHNLPARLTSFIGREREITSLVATIPQRRLVTLTGAGGSGKSRLAVETAMRLLESFPDGVWRVELAPLRDPGEVVPAISKAFGESASHAADPTGSLIDYLRDRHILLVLDNCEHLLESVGMVATQLLSSCSGVTVMATSREPLGIPGESLWLVPPLTNPDADASPEDQQNADAFRLFVKRAKDADSEFEVTDDNRGDIVAICNMVDGLPLALELAAARVSTLPPARLAERLSSDLGVLTAEGDTELDRHRTIRAALDWSYQLLDDETADVFRRLAVFRGGWTLRDSEAVLGASSTGVITDLVKRSLVERLRGRRLDYRLLEPIREYALEKFQASPVFAEVSELHGRSFLALAEEAEVALRGRDQVDWLHLMDEEHDNLRQAVSHAIDSGETRLGLQLVAALGAFWFMGGHWAESWEWLNKALEMAGEDHPRERAAAVYRTGIIQVVRVNHKAVLPLVTEALEICRSTGDRYGEAWCLHLIGHAETFDVVESSLGPMIEARDLFAALDCPWEVAWSNRFIGASLCAQDEAEECLDLLISSVSSFRELGDQWQTAYGLFVLGQAMLQLGDYGPNSARPYLLRCLRLSEQIGDRVWSAHAVSRLAIASHLGGQEDARSLFLEAIERHRLIGDDACLATTLGYLAQIEEANGNDGAAAGYVADAMRVGVRIDNLARVATNFDRLAGLAMRRGRRAESLRLLRAVQTALDDGTLPHHPLVVEAHEEQVRRLAVSLAPGDDLAETIPFALELAESIREEAMVDVD